MASFEVLEISGPNWPEIAGAATERLQGVLQDEPWDDADDGRQYAFREFRRVGSILAGFFAVQSAVPYWTYDDQGAAVFSEVEDAYQRILTLLLPQDGRVIVHNRRYFGTDLQTGYVRELFEEALTSALTDADIGPIRSIRPFSQVLTREQILELFLSEPGEVAEVNIRELHMRAVPDDFIFFNPEVDLNKSTRALFNTGLESVGKAQFEAAPHKSVKDATIVRGLAAAGTVAEFQVREAEYRRRRISRRRSPRFDVEAEREELEAATDAQIEEIRRAYEERYPPRYPRPDSYWSGTIFEPSEPSS